MPSRQPGGVRADSTEATLIIRVWFEGDPPSDLRARLIEVLRHSSRERVVATVATPEDLRAAVQAWIDALTSR